MWKIEKIVKKGDYLYAVVIEHPCSTKHGYVLHHRIVMENHLKRLLSHSEVVHHVIQLHGVTPKVESAISGNIVREFNSLDNPEQTTDNGMRRGHTPTA